MLFPVKGDFNINFSTLLKSRKILINSALIILALIISINTYSRGSRIRTVVKEEVNLETKKNDIMSQIAGTEKKILAYRDLLKERDISLVINNISHIAHDSGLKIIVVKPEHQKDLGVYQLLFAHLTVLAENYHKIGEFISKLESDTGLYKIDYLRITLNERNVPGETNFNLFVDLVITVIIFKG